MKRKKVCVFTTSRADYGLLCWLLREIQDDPAMTLQIVVTGSHLSHGFGDTDLTIEKDGFRIDRKIDVLLASDSELAPAKSVALGLVSFSDALHELKPDVVVLLGDRFELLAAAVASFFLKIPIAHIHGGETSQGSIDEAVRHSITKMSTLHFCANETYRRRIIQLGENPSSVFAFGAPGLDHLHRVKLPDRKELERKIGMDLTGKVALVTYHPVTLDRSPLTRQVGNLLSAIRRAGIKAVFTAANPDPGGRMINEKVSSFCESNPSMYRYIPHLGQFLYLGCMKNLDLMIGNSSSGLTEAPSFRLPVVNIGDRQKGRIKARNVVDVGYTAAAIHAGITRACSAAFRRTLKGMRSPYDPVGDGRVSYRIKETLKLFMPRADFPKKKFYDL
jgi:UDP-N-acetylglucosamine 2-epimerase (non-hydrolysing)/GDP/UDP-N,N'-diacetylbacillosamine 2-epimerase (hydrolysing)